MTDTSFSARVLSDLAPGHGQFTAADEHRHPVPNDSPTWGETCWWAFADPDHSLIGWLYLLTRPTLGVASLGAWIWDPSGSEARDLLHSKFYVHVPLPDGYDLDSLELLDGVYSQRVVEPLSQYAIRYRGHGVDLELDLRGAAPPQPLGIGPETGHADQPLWATGRLQVAGYDVAFDGPAFRDRTWSNRPETMAGNRNCYAWAVGEDIAFQLIAVLNDDEEPLFCGGFINRNGTVSPIDSMRRTVLGRGLDGRPTAVSVELHDEAGRELRATGTCSSTAALNAFTGHLTWATLVDWDIDGLHVWGEDHDSWTNDGWRNRMQHLAAHNQNQTETGETK